MTDFIETNVWSATYSSKDDPDEGFTIYIAASEHFEDALTACREYEKQYIDTDEYELEALKYVGALYHKDTIKEANP